MNVIGDLIARLCPDGVEYKTLGEVGELIRGRRFTKADYVNEGLGSIHYGEVYTSYGTSATHVRSFVRPDLRGTLRLARHGDLVIAATGENVEEVGKAVAWLGDDEVAVHDDCFIFRHTLDPRFASYYFQSSHFHAQKHRHVTDSKLARVSRAGLKAIRTPIPPMAIQQTVVDILDKMQHLEAELEAELGAEVEARIRQHAHYSRVLLDQIEAAPASVGSLGKWIGGMTPSKANPAYWEDGAVPWLASKDVSSGGGKEIRGRITSLALEQTSLSVVPSPSVAVVMRSNILRRTLPIGLIAVDTTVNQDIRALVPRSDVDAEYVYQALRADSDLIREACVRTDGSMAAVDSKIFFDWQIPLPSLDDQQRIAERLRNFHAVVRDVTLDLQAEIVARRNQYEYYRDLLLTFPEKTA